MNDLLIALCSCCTGHGGGRVEWEVAKCSDCGQPCSCEGCIAEVR